MVVVNVTTLFSTAATKIKVLLHAFMVNSPHCLLAPLVPTLYDPTFPSTTPTGMICYSDAQIFFEPSH